MKRFYESRRILFRHMVFYERRVLEKVFSKVMGDPIPHWFHTRVWNCERRIFWHMIFYEKQALEKVFSKVVGDLIPHQLHIKVWSST